MASERGGGRHTVLALAATTFVCLSCPGVTSAAHLSATVAATGDAIPSAGVLAAAEAPDGYDFRPLFAPLAPVLRHADLAICHQEVVLGTGTSPTYPRLRAPTTLARDEVASGWDMCSTASNHSLDDGVRGIRRSIQVQNAAGLLHTGTFGTYAASRRPVIADAGGIGVALLSYTEFSNRNDVKVPLWQVNFDERRHAILADARRARREGAAAVIVNMHWGHDYEAAPEPRHRRLARWLTAKRAITAILAQGPHVVWPIEFMNGKPVVFSEGNLLSADTRGLGDASGIAVRLRLVMRGARARATRVEYVPVINDPATLRVLPVDADEKDPGLAEAMRHAYRHAVREVGRSARVLPIPRRLSVAAP